MKSFDPTNITYPVTASPKLNGVYCRIDSDGFLRSRTGKYFPALQKFFAHNYGLELEGELYVHGWSLQKIISAVSPDVPNDLSAEIKFHAFSEHTIDDPRYSTVRVSPQLFSYMAVQTTYKAHLAAGFEGSVITDASGCKWKLKPYKDEEFLCTGILEGKGKRQFHVGKFCLRTADGKQFNCGGGQISYSLLRHYYQNPPIGKLITVRYHSASDDGIPLCPQFISVRTYE